MVCYICAKVGVDLRSSLKDTTFVWNVPILKIVLRNADLLSWTIAVAALSCSNNCPKIAVKCLQDTEPSWDHNSDLTCADVKPDNWHLGCS